MDKYSPSAAVSNPASDNYSHHKSIPTGDNEDGYGYPKNRKRNSKKFDVTEETPFTDIYKPFTVAKGVNSTNMRKKKDASCLKNTRCYFCDFCDNTSIHGFKFLGERGRYIIEKIWWMVIVCLALYGSGSLIYKTYTKWVDSPILVSFATTEMPIWKIPFPAVTICPEVNANPGIFNYTDVYLKYMNNKTTTAEEDEYFNLFALVCDTDQDFVNQRDTVTMSDEQLDKFLQAFSDVEAEHCTWNGEQIDCNETLSYIVTSEGWCRTFNMLSAEEVYRELSDFQEAHTIENTKAAKWSLEYGYPHGAGLNTYPRRTMLSGMNAGFKIDLFTADDDLDYLCGELQGFKVTLHHPGEEANMDNHFRVPLDQAVVVGVKPRMMTTSEEIRGYSPQARQCYLPGEKYLSDFLIYTQQNCMTECLKNFTLEKCDCLPFYMSGNENDTTCGAGSNLCAGEAKVSFLQTEVELNLNKEKGEITEQCDCLPSCTFVDFEAETSQTDWNWRKTFHLRVHDPDLDINTEKDHMSRLIIYYKDLQFMTSTRHELYGTVDFLANCGGLLGLFCGFSFTSFMEILYYLTLRLICNLKKFGSRVWSGDSELVEEEKERRHQNGPE